ncbi:DUF4190 domain-containing protein [Kitasatospora sp. NPDC088391]|uniref:DUF4190 domain-containing protein n=1 Tax=Kitasatospora sp. NPDC088391 TaxID=3364074 RepID=UPI003812203E
MPFEQEPSGEHDPATTPEQPAAPAPVSFTKPTAAEPAGAPEPARADSPAGADAPAEPAAPAAWEAPVSFTKPAAEAPEPAEPIAVAAVEPVPVAAPGAPAPGAPAPEVAAAAPPQAPPNPWAPAGPPPVGAGPAPAANPWAVAGPPPSGGAGAAPAANPWAVPDARQSWGGHTLPPPVGPGFPGGPAGPGQPGGAGYPGQPGGSRSLYTNGLAIASLVTGLICCVGFIAIGLGIGALNQIKRTGERGKGLAITGIVAGCAWLVVGALVLAFGDPGGDDDPWESGGTTTSTPHSSSKSAGSEPLNSPFLLTTGQCFDESAPQVPKVVACSGPHRGEVFWAGASITTQGEYPGSSRMRTETEKLCMEHLDGYVLDTWSIPDNVQYRYYYPDPVAWKRPGGRRVVCFLANADKTPLARTFRTDLGKLTADQRQVLDAVNPFDRALNEAPDEDVEVEDDPAAFRAWARTMDTASTELVDRLKSRTWTPAQQPAVDKLVAELGTARGHFRTAASAIDDKTLARELEAAYDHVGMDQIVELRRGAGLATLDEEPGKHAAGRTV